MILHFGHASHTVHEVLVKKMNNFPKFLLVLTEPYAADAEFSETKSVLSFCKNQLQLSAQKPHSRVIR